MLPPQVIKKIEDFVYAKPRSIQEVAEHIDKNWRTADRYIDEIEKEYGTLTTRVFREGTRGALKIVHWAAVEKVASSVFQQQLEEELLRAKHKEDFSAFDIFQHAPQKAKKAVLESTESEGIRAFTAIDNVMRAAQKQLLIFSGNLSFINFKQGKKRMVDTFDELVKQGISLKIVCRIDIAARKNVEELLALNFKYGKEMVEIRHREQPLRATIVDKSFFDMKEIKEPTGKLQELDKEVFLFYTIKDREWVDWLTRIFWKMFSSSVDASIRLQELDKIRVSP